ncbi:uncharacterized protein [Paramormyrops kingsleyae]|uniref:uncharacterized protein n=1 Tax=Paramormyrops kingsleyae TaxID=1676925 RepID=UPI003B97C864
MEMGKQLINNFPRVPSYIIIPGDIIQCRETMAMEILSGSVSLEEACQWCGRFQDTDRDGDWTNNKVIKFTDDTTVIRLISGKESELAYRDEVEQLSETRSTTCSSTPQKQRSWSLISGKIK